MPRLTFSERLRSAKLSAGRTRRKAVARLLYSPALRWRYGSAVADQLLIIPQELRTADPSFWSEVEIEHFGLAGCLAALDGKSPFDIRPPSDAWQRALHGFSWLRHLAAAEESEAKLTAQKLAVEWVKRNRAGHGMAWEPRVLGRRLISWITHADILLDEADPKTYETITSSLGFQIIRLSATWRDAPRGMPQLVALLAIVFADLCVAGHERRLKGAERQLSEELNLQILPDGGHVSRNPAVLVDLLLDLLPLSQCFLARERPLPEAIAKATQNILAMLRYLRMGDGQLARFNGMSVGLPAALATVLAYDDVASASNLDAAPASNYARLERADTVVIVDVGPPPPIEFASEAHAGCLSFEMSVGRELLFVNAGAPRPSDADWHDVSRSTANHNTLRLGEKSSSKIIRHAQLEELVSGAPIRFPSAVSASVSPGVAGIELDAHHDGYVRRFGLLHERKLVLSDSGQRLDGIDRIRAPGRPMRLGQDLPYAIHFRLHPNVTPQSTGDAKMLLLTLANGDAWRFSADGATLHIEDSVYLADPAGAQESMQIVVRGATFGESEVMWSLMAV